jgi:hypothetical protein|tara:strand:+ start:402 stop:572 length:171 start_codon:yes stop_codon:yes gene_type:complete
MSGSTARKIRELVGYDKKNGNHIEKKLYKIQKKRYIELGEEKFWKSVQGRFTNKQS